MARKINVKLILELRDAGMGRNAIASARNISKHSVSDVFHRADELELTYQDIRPLSDEDVYRRFFPERNVSETVYKEVDYENVHKELKRVGVTLKLLWEEYSDHCHKSGDIPVGYRRFCEGYQSYTVSNKLTSHLEHKPGVICEVDWSGKTMAYADPETGEIIKVYLFVANLPYSQSSYVEPCLDMKEDTWLRCHIHMYDFFGGVTTRLVCDNLKTGVIRHPREGDILLNESYEALGEHYMTAIMPAPVRHPKAKASVEGTVEKIATAIIAELRNELFTSFGQLKGAVRLKLDKFNKKPFQKRPYSRYEVFHKEERQSLRPLPEMPFEIAHWIYKRKVSLNSHISYRKNYYSCPYMYIGREADLRVTDTTLEIYVDHKRVSTHPLFPEYRTNKYSTHPEDMPERFRRQEWTKERITRWAYTVGPNTGKVVDKIFAGVSIEEQGYNASLSVLRLGKAYSEARLEIACGIALSQITSPRYRHLKAILSSDQDTRMKDAANEGHTDKSGGYLRGASYYGGRSDDQ